MPARTSSITRYQESYLDDKMQYMYDAAVDEKIPGAIVTRKVNEYEIDGNPVSRYTTVVLGMTNDEGFEAEIARAFKSAGHDLNEVSEAQPVADRVSAVQTSIPVEEDVAF
jgi:dihydroorotate dehydrogenase